MAFTKTELKLVSGSLACYVGGTGEPVLFFHNAGRAPFAGDRDADLVLQALDSDLSRLRRHVPARQYTLDVRSRRSRGRNHRHRNQAALASPKAIPNSSRR
jgi:hypothetical protein